MSQVYFISFSGSTEGNDRCLENRQRLLHKTAQRFGNIDEDIAWQRDDLLQTNFYINNRRILDEPRGAGLWAWKPYIILETLKKLKPDDWVIYNDIGKPFRRGDNVRSGNMDIGNTIYTPVNSIIEFASNHNGFTPGVWIPHYGLAHMWTKRDCFVGMGCDQQRFHLSPHVQAGYSAWSNRKQSINFLQEWLKWCKIPAIISDHTNIYAKPNFSDFREHRHDQSILSNLTVKHELTLFGSKEQSLAGYRNFNFILRHMLLEQAYQKARQQFQLLFDKKQPELPTFLEELISLQFLTECRKGDHILIDSEADSLVWQKGLPELSIDLYTAEKQKPVKNSKLSQNHYAGIFIPNTRASALNKSLLDKLYQALRPGGMLLLGRYTGCDPERAAINGDFGDLVNWINQQQRLPENCGSSLDQRQNALTLGNALNPIEASITHGESCYLILIKPKTYLGND